MGRCDLTHAVVMVTGLTWQDKVTALRAKMAERKISWFIATALDETACERFFLHLQLHAGQGNDILCFDRELDRSDHWFMF